MAWCYDHGTGSDLCFCMLKRHGWKQPCTLTPKFQRWSQNFNAILVHNCIIESRSVHSPSVWQIKESKSGGVTCCSCAAHCSEVGNNAQWHFFPETGTRRHERTTPFADWSICHNQAFPTDSPWRFLVYLLCTTRCDRVSRGLGPGSRRCCVRLSNRLNTNISYRFLIDVLFESFATC